MKEKNEIDSLFKEGIQRDYPVDENLWAQVESQLPTKPSPTSFFSLNNFLFMLVIFCCSLIPKDNGYSQQHIKTHTSYSPVQLASVNSTSNYIEEAKPQFAILETSTIQIKEGSTKSNLYHVNGKSLTTPEAVSPSKIKQPTTYSKKTASIDQSSLNNTHTIKESKENIVHKELNDVASTTVTIQNEKQYNVNRVQSISHQLNPLDLVDLEFSSLNNDFKPLHAKSLQLPMHKSVFHFYEIELFRDAFIQKNISATAPEIELYKEESEQALSNFTTGINTVRQKKHLVYGLGVQFNQYSERVSYTIEEESIAYITRVDTSYRIVNSQFNSNGTPVLLIEEVLVESRIPTTIIRNDQLIATNTLKRIRIPVFAGYNLRFKNWSTEFRTALIPSFLFQSQGITIRQDQNQIELLDTETTEQFSFSINNQIRVGYAINEFFALGASVYLENDLKSYSKGVDSKINHQGVGVWLAIKP